MQKSVKEELESMTDKELLEVLHEFPQEQKKLRERMAGIQAEIIENQNIKVYIKGVIAKRNEQNYRNVQEGLN